MLGDVNRRGYLKKKKNQTQVLRGRWETNETVASSNLKTAVAAAHTYWCVVVLEGTVSAVEYTTQPCK